jgi:hypothetical protein
LPNAGQTPFGKEQITAIWLASGKMVNGDATRSGTQRFGFNCSGGGDVWIDNNNDISII